MRPVIVSAGSYADRGRDRVSSACGEPTRRSLRDFAIAPVAEDAELFDV